jgi:hypothetical protein
MFDISAPSCAVVAFSPGDVLHSRWTYQNNQRLASDKSIAAIVRPW